MLTETWTLPGMHAPDIPGYTCFSSSRAFKNVQARRGSGGVACYVKNGTAYRFELWKVSLAGSILWLRSREKFTRRTGDHHLYIGLVYIPPKGRTTSTYEQLSNSLPAYDLLQKDIAEVYAENGLAIIAGDFNARTGSATDVCQEDFSDILDASLLPDPESRLPVVPRQSADTKICAYGRSLLELCQVADMHILNGRTQGDTAGKFTCRTAQGCSVVDYFISSTSLRDAIVSLNVGEKCAESDHCPLSLRLDLQASRSAKSAQKERTTSLDIPVTVQKIKYDASKADDYREHLIFSLSRVFSAPDPQCCLATALQSCISGAALVSFGRLNKHTSLKVNQKWYDAECKSARAALRNTVAQSPEHAAMLKSYKQLLRRKRRAWQRKAQRDFCELAARNPRAFWRGYKERQSHQSDISPDSWKASFEALYRAPEATATSPAEAVPVNSFQPAAPPPVSGPPDATEPACDFPE